MSDEQVFEDIGKSFIRVASVQKQFNEHREEILNLNMQINGLVETKNQMVKQLKKFMELIQERDATINSLHKNMFQLSGKILQLDEENQKLKRDVDLGERKYQQVLEENLQKKNEYADLSQKVDDAIAQHENNIKALQQQLAKSQQQVFITQKKLTQKDSHIADLQSRISTLLSQNQKLQLTISRYSVNIDLINYQKQSQSNLANKRLVELQKNQAQDQKKVGEIFNELLDKAKNLEDDKRLLQDEVKVQADLIAVKQKQFDDMEKLYMQLKQQQTLRQKSQIKQKSELLKLYNQALDQQCKHEAKILGLSQQWASLITENGLFKKEIQNLSNQIKEIQSQRILMLTKNIAITDQIAELDQRLQKANKQLGDTRNLQQEFYQLQTTKEQLQKNMQKLQEEISHERQAIKIQLKQYQEELNRNEKELQRVRGQNFRLLSKSNYSLEDAKEITQFSISSLTKSIKEMKFKEEDFDSTFVAQLRKAKKEWIQLFQKYQHAAGHGKNDPQLEKKHAGKK